MSSDTIPLLLSSLTKEKLHPFLCEYAVSHPEFAIALIEKFATNPSEKLSGSYDKEVCDCFYYPHEEWDLDQMKKAVSRMIARAEVLRDCGGVGDYASILLCVLENILLRFEKEEHFCCFDDWYPLQMTLDDLEKKIQLMFKAEGMSKPLRHQITERLKGINANYEDEYGIFDLETFIKTLG